MAGKGFLFCGILSVLWYVAVNIIVPMQDPGYRIASQTISELSAIDAPTRPLWFALCMFYSILFMAFGIGIWLTAKGERKQEIVAFVVIFDALFGIFWPPMHQRDVIAGGGGTVSDTLHIVWAYVHLVLMLLMIGFGAASFGRPFRIFSVMVVLVFLVFGLLTARESGGIESGTPTPYIGIWERINIAAYSVWVVVYGILLIKKQKQVTTQTQASRQHEALSH